MLLPILGLVLMVGLAVSFGHYLWNYKGTRTEYALKRAQATITAMAVAPVVQTAPQQIVESVAAPVPVVEAGVLSDTGVFRSEPVVDVLATVTATPVLEPAAVGGGFADVVVPESSGSVYPAPDMAPAVLPPLVLPNGWSVVSLFSVVEVAPGVNRVCVDVALH